MAVLDQIRIQFEDGGETIVSKNEAGVKVFFYRFYDFFELSFFKAFWFSSLACDIFSSNNFF